jgi:hypothetical protein
VLLATRQSGFLLLLVAVLPPVHDLADDRAGGGGDLDEIEAARTGERQGFFHGNDADLGAVGVHETYRREPDHLIDACAITFVGDESLLLGRVADPPLS